MFTRRRILLIFVHIAAQRRYFLFANKRKCSRTATIKKIVFANITLQCGVARRGSHEHGRAAKDTFSPTENGTGGGFSARGAVDEL